MLPTLAMQSDILLIDKSYRRGRGVQVGDIVAFASVVEPGERVMKRVVGLEGDFVMRNTPEKGSDVMLQVSFASILLLGK
jgi:inner membrane protease subunit 1